MIDKEIKEENINLNKLNYKRNLFVKIIDNAFTHEQCSEFIKLSENKGYEIAKLNTSNGEESYNPYIRNNYRCIIDDLDISNKIWNIIKDYIPELWENKKVIGINERLRFLKYNEGQQFIKHKDGYYVRPDNTEKSFITFQLYLNDNFDGGCTTFIGNNDEQVIQEIKPKTGRVLLFEHGIYHKGDIIKKGTKYCIRSDIMYSLL